MKKIAFIIIFLISSTFLYADTIYLKDGRSFDGEITEETDEIVRIREKVGAS